MKRAEEVEKVAINLVHDLPHNTVVILANVNGHRLHQILREPYIVNVVKEAQEVLSIYTHDSEENK